MLGTDRFQSASRPAENGFVGRAKWLRRPWPKKSVHALVMGVSSWLQTVRSEPNFGPEAERMGRCRTVAGDATGAPEKTTRPLQRTLISVRKDRPCQAKAKASRLEHKSKRPAAVTARNPSDTKSWLRIVHLRISMLDARPNLLKFSERAH